MPYQYSVKRSRRSKRRNTQRHRGGRAGAGHYGSNTTTGAASVLSQWTGITPGVIRGGKRGIPIHSALHSKKTTRKNRKTRKN